MQGADISRLLDHIAATLYYNSVEVKDGFDVFDVDGDGRQTLHPQPSTLNPKP
jgi:hypothetical protein